MLEITGNEIKELSDSDLRSLVGLLCEADLRTNNLSTAGVTWGGHQDAKDGGIDVRVELISSPPNPDGFIPRAKTGYQVKNTDMPPSEIIKEMCPNGDLRPTIKELSDACGAYIIVSGIDSTSDSALRSRRQAMIEAASKHHNSSNLKLDFYDRDRLAAWVRNHPSLVLWVREKIGQPIQGWKPYENWSNTSGGLNEPYLIDNELCLHNEAKPRSDGMTTVDGINSLREILVRPASSIRLIGLSGVGKTRFVQALFDNRVGKNPLNPSLVFYADTGDGPNPDPRTFADRLIAIKRRAILVVDNCSPDLHRRLTSVCTASGSLVSLITIEYDVREDQPEETIVFRLEPASLNLIEKLILTRFKHIGQVDACTIAQFSGGNARLAVALSNTIQKGETILGLKDDDLFRRLFYQRNESNNTLLRSAEVCALVYSFECESESGTSLELELLGSLANRSVTELFGDVSELKRRDLVQQRSIWRAVLPHALANKLAQRALENIPNHNILSAFNSTGAERLLKSFSRRLGFLPNCDNAMKIAESWLSEGGLLSDITNLNDLGITLLCNIAPIVPKSILAKIEHAANGENGKKFTSRKNNHHNRFTHLLRSLAYDPELFDRCVNLILCFALSEDKDENFNSIRDLLRSLFYIHLSGTHASATQRLIIIDRLVKSPIEKEQTIGLYLLGAALEAWHFHSYYEFDFGAHSRDYGYVPKTKEDIRQWYNGFINLTEELSIGCLPIASKAKELLADQFRGLWVKAGVTDDLERVARSIASKGFWSEGWTAVITIIRLDSEGMEPCQLKQLRQLEQLLSPRNLIEQARTYAFLPHRFAWYLTDEEDAGEIIKDQDERAEIVTFNIGKEVARDPAIFKTLLPQMVSGEGARLHSFGQGIGEGCEDPLLVWLFFRQQLSTTDDSQRNYLAIRGFLDKIWEKNHELCEKLLDDAITDDIFGPCFPLLQISVEIDEGGVQRLQRSLYAGIAPIHLYRNLAYCKSHETITDENLSKLLQIIASKPGGLDIAFVILHMRLHANKSAKRPHSDIIISIGKNLLCQKTFERESNRQDRMDFELSEIVHACLADINSVATAKILSKNLTKALSEYNIYPMNCRYLLKSIAQNQPLVFLDEFLGNTESNKSKIFADDFDHRHNPLTEIENNIIIRWCEVDPTIRYPLAAASVDAYRQNEDDKRLEWSPIALAIISKAPDGTAVFNSCHNHRFNSIPLSPIR